MRLVGRKHVVLPEQHPEYRLIELVNGHRTWSYRECRYMAPAEVILLPENNSSAENFASWIGREVRKRFIRKFGPTQIRKLRVCVSETSGQHGVYTYSDEVD